MSGKWKIFYTDGTTFSNADGPPSAAPKKTVQVINVEDGRCGRRVLKFAEYYVWAETIKRWTDQADSTTAMRRLIKEPFAIVLEGEYLMEGNFEKILIAAHDDEYILPQSPGEPPHEAWSAK